jgi:putative ABC transport system permease protein
MQSEQDGANGGVGRALARHWAILVQDLRYAMRTFDRSRGFALAAILVTALGVGANTATFSVADFVLVRPLAFRDPHELVRLCEGPLSGGGWGCNNQLSPANYRDVKAMNRSFQSLGVFTGRAVNLVGRGEPMRIGAVVVTAEVLSLLGVRPIMGRVFDTTRAGELDANSVVLGYGLWQSQFGGDPGVLGSTLSLDGTPHVVIGIMPATFRFPTDDVQLWMPLLLREEDFADRNDTYLDGIGRLRKGVSFEQARSDIAAIFARLAREHPATNAETGFSFFRQRDEMAPRYRIMLLALCGASLCMLLLTCANLANLLLARAAGRERELAVRAALGAGRERLVRQMLTESILLALLGGIAGVLTAALVVPLLAHLVPSTIPIASKPSIDPRVFAIAAVFSALTGLGFGLLPALRVGGRTGFAALREGARGSASRQRLRTLLVAIEVAVSVMLLISSGLLIRAVWRVQAVDPGFVPANVLTLKTALPTPKFDSAARRADFYGRVLTDVRALPAVEYAAYTSGLPMVMTGGIAGVSIPGQEVRPARREGVSMRLVSSQFFSTMRIPIRRGRDVSDNDTWERPLVAVVSESFVQRYWPNADPIGRTFEMRAQTRTVVGVVGDIKVRGLERTNEPQVYLPANQPPDGLGGIYVPKDLLIRSSRGGMTLVPAVRQIVRRVDPEQPVSHVQMLSDVVGGQTATRTAQLRILSALAILALLLAGVGIHGLLAFTVAQRSREIGVRLALGAQPSVMARMIVSEAGRMAILGVVPGVLGAYVAARTMSALLFGVEPGDPLTISLAAVLCLAIAVLGALRPALRAARVDPMSALRAD